MVPDLKLSLDKTPWREGSWHYQERSRGNLEALSRLEKRLQEWNPGLNTFEPPFYVEGCCGVGKTSVILHFLHSLRQNNVEFNQVYIPGHRRLSSEQDKRKFWSDFAGQCTIESQGKRGGKSAVLAEIRKQRQKAWVLIIEADLSGEARKAWLEELCRLMMQPNVILIFESYRPPGPVEFPNPSREAGRAALEKCASVTQSNEIKIYGFEPEEAKEFYNAVHNAAHLNNQEKHRRDIEQWGGRHPWGLHLSLYVSKVDSPHKKMDGRFREYQQHRERFRQKIVTSIKGDLDDYLRGNSRRRNDAIKQLESYGLIYRAASLRRRPQLIKLLKDYRPDEDKEQPEVIQILAYWVLWLWPVVEPAVQAGGAELGCVLGRHLGETLAELLQRAFSNRRPLPGRTEAEARTMVAGIDVSEVERISIIRETEIKLTNLLQDGRKFGMHELAHIYGAIGMAAAKGIDFGIYLAGCNNLLPNAAQGIVLWASGAGKLVDLVKAMYELKPEIFDDGSNANL